MKYYFAFFIFIAACNQQSNTIVSEKKNTDFKAPAIDCLNCFQTADTLNTKESRACGNWFYQKLDSQYILAIHFTDKVSYDTCIEVTIDSNHQAILYEYKNKNASLFAYCNDYGANSVTKELNKASGKYFIKLYKPTEWRGTDDPTGSIFIPQINFTDSNRIISFKNILLWKTFQYGPAG